MSDYEDDDFESDASPSKQTSARPSARDHATVVSPAKKSSEKALLQNRGPKRAQSSNASSRRSSKPSVTRRTVSQGSAARPALILDPDQKLLRELRQENIDLRSQLVSLNRVLDEHLTQKGQRVSRIQPVPKSSSAMLPSDRLVAKIEVQRKVNHDIEERLRQAGNLDRVSELMNRLGALSAELNDLRSENRSQENVYQNQMVKCTVTEKIDGEISAVRSNHNDEVQAKKSQTRKAKEEREREMEQYKHYIRAVERMEEKLRVQESIGTAISSVSEMQEQVEEKDRMIDALKYQVAVLSRTNTNEKRKVKQRASKVGKEEEQLRAEADYLRQKLGLAADLNVDTRV